MALKTPEQIAADVLAGIHYGDDGTGHDADRAAEAFQSGWLDANSLEGMLIEAVKADRAQQKVER